jgi:hypothetical protein
MTGLGLPSFVFASYILRTGIYPERAYHMGIWTPPACALPSASSFSTSFLAPRASLTASTAAVAASLTLSMAPSIAEDSDAEVDVGASRRLS